MGAHEPPIWGTVPGVHVRHKQMCWVSDVSGVSLYEKRQVG